MDDETFYFRRQISTVCVAAAAALVWRASPATHFARGPLFDSLSWLETKDCYHVFKFAIFFCFLHFEYEGRSPEQPAE
jgi:hypothetical protein